MKRFVIVSTIDVHRRDKWLERATYYSVAKHYADFWLEKGGLDYTIIRSGGLTNDPGTKKVKVVVDLEYGQISRQDVASVIIAALENTHTIGKAFDIVGGKTSIEDALKTL
ncbi:NAD(P)H-binding protein [Priestia sp. SIMBA_032]|uniref:NAD(P)H-binding protein n=1 Tax=Priestia sp. SIMBA_032 TaxID=3085775 RepID=UPI003979F0DD